MHHLPHLHKLFQQAVYVTDTGTAAFCNSESSGTIHQIVIAAFLESHGTDDGIDAVDIGFIKIGIFKG